MIDRARCEHCGHLADTVIVVRRITTYERHSPTCPVLDGGAVRDHDHDHHDLGGGQ